MTRRHLTAAATLAAVATIGAGAAHGATPKPGTYVWQQLADGGVVGSVNLTVNGDSTKITNLFAHTIACGSPLSASKKIKVKRNGKFDYDGKASTPVGDPGQIKVKGRFLKRKRAEGTVELGECKAKVSFKAKYAGTKG